MKTPSTKLFRLIQKMTPSEKRYFKRFGLLQQKNNANKYTLLFDAINAQKEYDEAALIEQFNDYDFVNNFSEIKKYLFNQIQKVLRNFHAQSSVDIILYGYLSDISVLYDKEMYHECNKLIQKTKKNAQKHEKWNLLLLLSQWKRNLIKTSHQVRGIEEYINKEIEQDKHYISLLENEQQYFNKYLERTLHLRKFGPNIPLENPLPQPATTPLTFRSKHYYHARQGLSGDVA